MIINNVWFELKNGCRALLRSPLESDAYRVLEYWKTTAAETEFLLHYPEECERYTEESEKKLWLFVNSWGKKT